MAVDPKCLEPSVEFGSPGEATVVASICGFSLGLPKFPIPPKLKLPALPIPPLPIPRLSFQLTCDPNKPIDVSAGLSFGGGKLPCSDPNPDDEEATQAVAA